jgi:transposase
MHRSLYKGDWTCTPLGFCGLAFPRFSRHILGTMGTKEVSVGLAIYTDEFKDGAVKRVLEGGHSVQDVAGRLSVSSRTIYTYLRERGGNSKTSKNEQTIDNLKGEVSKLKAELKRTKEERDISKKAAARERTLMRPAMRS